MTACAPNTRLNDDRTWRHEDSDFPPCSQLKMVAHAPNPGIAVLALALMKCSIASSSFRNALVECFRLKPGPSAGHGHGENPMVVCIAVVGIADGVFASSGSANMLAPLSAGSSGAII